MSTMIWFNIFSGFSARAIMSLMLDRIRVESLLKMPMSVLG
jgi:hypothetical protein